MSDEQHAQVTSLHDGSQKTPTPYSLPEANSPRAISSRGAQLGQRIGLGIGVVVLAIASGIGGSYALLSSGLVKLDATQTITQNRDKIVLQQGEIVADVATKVSPSVVSITTQGVTQGRSSLFGGTGAVIQGAGSGIVVSKDGVVMTNRHVVPEGTSSVTVIMADGTQHKDVTVIGHDTVNDVAFLKIKDVSNLPAITIGDSSKVAVGQQVVAVGNALGEYQNTVTSGIISGIHRPVQASSDDQTSSENLENLFQTDAAINPGNSGGPLLNLQGEVIGMNTAVAQDAQGIGFAIPVNDVKGLLNSVLQKGKLERAYLGVRYVSLDERTASQYSVSVKQGALLLSGNGGAAVVSGGPADKAGLKEKDVITAVNGQALSATQTLAGALGQFSPGDTITLTVQRGNGQLTIKATLGLSDGN